jgi:predicted dehydrogenase
MLDEGGAGRPTMFTGRFWCNMLGSNWWRRKDGSGGQVYEQLIHLYDLALHLLGQPDSVCGFMANLTHGDSADYTIEDTSIGTIRFAGGSLATITGSNCALPEHYIGDCRLVCEKLLFDYMSTGDWRVKDTATFYRHDGGKVESEKVTEDGDPFQAETQDFLRAVREGGTTRTPVQDGLVAVRLVSAVMESSENNGEPVRL